MNVLELFSGTGSVGKCCENIGFSYYSVDLVFDADFKGDIMDFDYKQFPRDWFEVVWASPPCTNYSKLQDCWLGRMRKGKIYTKEIQQEEMIQDDKLVLRVFEIIDYFQPEYWFIENPGTSRMKDRPFMKDVNNYVVDYCMYSDWGYKKRTRIWTNRTDFKPLVCDGKGTCGNMIDTQHKKALGNGYEMIDGKKVLVNTKKKRLLHKTNLGNTERKKITLGNGTTQQDRYRVPEKLIYSLLME